MKKSKYIFILACFMGMALQGCQQDSNPGSDCTPSLTARYIAMETNTLSFGASTNLTQSMKVTAVTTPWQFTGMDSWLKLSPSTGSESATVQAVAEENTSGDNSRTCILTFSSTASDYSYNASVQATQSYAEPYITLSESSLAFDGRAATATVTVKSNISWTATSSTDWLTVEAASDGGSITVKVAENTTNAARQATVTLTGKTTATLTVAQAVAKIEGDQATLTYAQAGGTYQLSIASEASWTASTSQSWLQIDPASGAAGTTEVLVSATPNESVNERKGYVSFSIGGVKQIDVAVIQMGQYLESDVQELSFKSTEETKTLQISSNIAWSLQSKPSWVTLSETSGTGDKTLQVTVSDNPQLQSRSGSLIFGTAGSTVSDTVAVYQEAKHFNPEAFSVLHFSDKAGSDTLKFETDASWTAASNDEWITIAPLSGSGDGRIVVTVTENTSDDARSGSVSLTVGGTVKTAAVEQDGKYFTVTTGGQATVPSTGGTHTVSFQTNDSWTVEACSEWMTATPVKGDGSSSVSFKAGDNSSINTRTDTSYIRPLNLQGIKVVTLQAARYLRVDHTSLHFFAKGGTSEKVVVETDATYSITTETSWLTIQQDGNTFTATANAYTEKTQREGKITLTMTGLRAGESYKIDLPVTQYAEGAYFTIERFSDNENWDLAGEAGAVITVTGFGNNEDWNQSGNTSLKVTKDGYQGSDNWNQNGDESVNAGRNGYGDSEGWNQNGDESVDAGRNGYGDSEGWNQNGDESVNADRNGYDENEDWNVK